MQYLYRYIKRRCPVKKIFKGLLILTFVLVLTIAVFAVKNWNNIKALITAVNYSEDEINALVEKNEMKTNEVLGKLTDSELRPLTNEEMEMYKNGEITTEDVINLIKGNENNTSKIDDIISQVYALRSEFLNSLAVLEKEAVATAKAIPKKERTATKKIELVEQFVEKGSQLEKQCDARMDALISKLRAELKKAGRDTSIISDVYSVYEAEKTAKKSQLLGKYK